MSYPKAKLCHLCEIVLSSHWVERKSLTLVDNEQSSKTPEGISNDNYDNDDNSTDISSSGSFYEAPEWVILEKAAALGVANYQSPAHHSITELSQSASAGCYLCLMFWDRVRHEIDALPEARRAIVDRLLSFVTARPYRDESFEGEDLVNLELSYFMDGLIQKHAYTLSVDVVLYEISATEVVTEGSFQPPLDHETHENGLERCISRINQWISICENSHARCEETLRARRDPSAPHRLPTRLLFLKKALGSPKLHLHITKNYSSDTKYATLSHCWGLSQFIKLLKENYTDLCHSIDYTSLPKTFQDAIDLSLALGIEYLWIDSLCIIQDSRDDWLTEAALMCSVYSNSWVNIAATASQDGTGGLFHTTSLVKNCEINATWNGLPRGLYLCVDNTAWQRRIEDAPLNQRAWVLQERLLSRRTIHCAYDQIWWSCVDAPNCCETFPTGALVASHINLPSLAPWLDVDNVDRISSNKAWLDIVCAYTKSNLTYGSDKLIAIAGLAKEFQNRKGFRENDYLAGLWRDNLLTDLLWRTVSGGVRKTEQYRAPSWSWASIDGQVYFRQMRDDIEAAEYEVAKILKTHTSPVKEWCGPVNDGWLDISGPLIRIRLRDADTSASYGPFLAHLDFGEEIFLNGEGFNEALDHDGLYEDWPKDGKNITYACLRAFHRTNDSTGEYLSEGLLVEPVREDSDEYRRIGWLQIFHKTSSWAMSCQQFRKSYVLR